MAPNVLKRSARGLHRKRKTPKDRKQNPDKVTVTYFPGEAARILRLKATDYHQLRRLFRILAKTSPEETAAKAKKKWTWSRYEFRDLVALRTAVRLAQRAGGRLDMKSVEDTCGVLRKLFGLASPLTEVQLERMSDTVVAQVGGRIFDATTGQRLMDEVVVNVTSYVQQNCATFQEQRACLRQAATQSSEIFGRTRRKAATAIAATGRGGK